MKKLIYDSYCEAVAFSQVSEELKRALKTNERTPRFLENLEKEFKGIKRHIDALTIKNAVYDLTNIYLNNLNRHANERMMTDLERFKAQTELNKINKFKKDVDTMLETGVITEDMLED